MAPTQIIEAIEHTISPKQHEQITALRNDCFPDCQENRSYFKQLPHFRLLAFQDNRLVGHLGIDHRMMAFNRVPSPIFGIVDLCVNFDSREQGIATAMLQRAEQIALESKIDYMVLLAKDHRIYCQRGYVAISEICEWLRIDNHMNYGVAVETIESEVLIKSLQEKPIPSGPIDFLGYMF